MNHATVAINLCFEKGIKESWYLSDSESADGSMKFVYPFHYQKYFKTVEEAREQINALTNLSDSRLHDLVKARLIGKTDAYVDVEIELLIDFNLREKTVSRFNHHLSTPTLTMKPFPKLKLCAKNVIRFEIQLKGTSWSEFLKLYLGPRAWKSCQGIFQGASDTEVYPAPTFVSTTEEAMNYDDNSQHPFILSILTAPCGGVYDELRQKIEEYILTGGSKLSPHEVLVYVYVGSDEGGFKKVHPEPFAFKYPDIRPVEKKPSFTSIDDRLANLKRVIENNRGSFDLSYDGNTQEYTLVIPRFKEELGKGRYVVVQNASLEAAISEAETTLVN